MNISPRTFAARLEPSSAGASRAGCLLLLCLAGAPGLVTAQRFDNWTVAPSLANAVTSNMATDPVTGDPTVLMTNGIGGSETMRWNGSAFVSLGIANTPGVAQGEMLAPFSVGGATGFVHLDSAGSTSVWTGGPSWTSLGVLTPSPSARTFGAVASVPGPGGEAFVCGGGGTVVVDLWSFNGTSWTNRTPVSGPRPLDRVGASLAVNGTGGLLLFGGSTTTGSLFGDLWEIGASGSWQLAGKGPVRAFHTSMLDISRGVLLVAGGFSSLGATNDMWSLPLPRTSVVGVVDWTQVTANLPFTAGGPGFVTGALDSVTNEPVLADAIGIEVLHDKVASCLVRGESPTTACAVPNLQLVASPVVEPRVGTSTVTVPVGGLTGVAGAPMILGAEFVVPGIGFSTVTPIPGTSCLVFLSPAATTIATTLTGAGGQYQFNLVIPPNPAFVGTVIDMQAFGLVGAFVAASQAARIVIGQS